MSKENIQKDFIENVIVDFKATELYSDEFLRDLEDGLLKSSYTIKK